MSDIRRYTDHEIADAHTRFRMAIKGQQVNVDEYVTASDHDAAIAQLTRERDRWREAPMRQAATINRLAAATEDRNVVDAKRQELHDADMRALAAEFAELRHGYQLCHEHWKSNLESLRCAEARVQALEAAVDNAGVLSDWINRARSVVTDLMFAYERRIRSDCTTAEQIAARPWTCSEYIMAERLLADQPKAVVVLTIATQGEQP